MPLQSTAEDRAEDHASSSRWRSFTGIAAFAIFMLYAATQREALAVAWHEIQPQYLILLGMQAALALWAQGKAFQRSCREFGTSLSERESLALAILTTAGNYLGTVRLGTVAKAVYLKRAHRLPITDTIAILVGGSIVMALTGGACGLLLLGYLRAWQTPAGTTATITLVIAFALLLAALMAPRAAVKRVVQRAAPAFARTRLARMIDAWSIVGRTRLVSSLVLWNLIILAISLLGFYIGFTLLLGNELRLTAALAFTLFTGLASLISLTPGNLGVQEFLIVALANSFHFGQDAGVIVAASLRLVQLVVVAALLPVAWPLVGRELFGSRSNRPTETLYPR